MFAYGAFLNALVYFLIMGFAIFMLVRGINRLVALNAAPAAPASTEPAAPPEDVVLLREIRDSLKK